MRKHDNTPPAFYKNLPYDARLRRYEQDKNTLLRELSHLPAMEFEAELKRLQKKWGID